MEHGNQEIFLQISRRRVRKDLDSKCYWTSEQQYWKLRDNSTGIQNSKGKLLFWNSVFFLDVFLPRKRKTRETRNRRATKETGEGNSHCKWQCPRQGRSAGSRGDFLGKMKFENNWFTQIFCKEIYLSGWEFKIKSLRGTLYKLSKWTKTIIIRKKSFERKLILIICFSREYISIIM